MGKFINTNMQNNVSKLIESGVDRLDNKYIAMLEEKPTPLIFYNLDEDESTLDESSGLEYSHIGSTSPFRYNKINGIFGYGLQKIQIQIEEGDFGAELSDVDGEMTITPDLIIPNINSYFIIQHLKHPYLFKVIDVQQDTLNNGKNYYKISYKLDHDNQERVDELEKQVTETFEIIYNNIGTKYKAVVKTSDYKLINIVDESLITLKLYFKSLFYDGNVQTFIFHRNDERFYDPYLIEFIKRNELLSGDGEYIYVGHQTSLENTFILDYDRSFFRCLEKKDLSRIYNYRIDCTGVLIDELSSIFNSRYDDYFKITYNYPKEVNYHGGAFYILSNDIIDSINKKIMYDSPSDKFKNIIIKYFNNKDITKEDLDSLLDINYSSDAELFYLIPMIIMCLEYYIKTMLSKHENNS